MKARAVKYVYVDGRVVPTGRATVHVFDRGLLYGDGLFETLRAYRGKPFALDEHLARLRSSAAFLAIEVPHRPWERDIAALLRRNQLLRTDASVRITLTRGTGVPRLVPPARLQPTLIIASARLDPSVTKAQRQGVRVVLLPFARHGFLAEHKVLNYVPAILGQVFATRHSAFEGVFVDRDGHITEGTTTNVFVWRRNQLHTPAAAGILPGVTRRMVMEAAVAAGVRVTERRLTAQDLLDADEAFLTSSLVEVLPITALHDQSIGTGRPGVRTRRLQRLYRQMVDQALTLRSSR